jgi:hypothetical protein
MISLRIDVSKIDKSRLFKGEKGTYLDCVLIETTNNKYNDWMIKESQSKEEREAGREAAILGSGKTINKKPIEAPESTVNYERDSMKGKAGSYGREEIQDDTPTDDGGLPF